MTCAPVVLFVYNRIDHTRRTVEALSSNMLARNTDLIIFSDAARSLDKRVTVDLVRAYLTSITGFRTVTIHCRPYNFGLAKSIIDGVTEVLVTHESVIVMEDDLITSPYFLTYMNEGLRKYAIDDRVISIHGYVYPVKGSLPEAFFIQGADCWGWATWRRGWLLFNSDGRYLLAELNRKRMIDAFDFNGAYPYSKMLINQIQGNNDSWAVRWYASAFLMGKLTLYPGRSLVQNIGNDSTGTHCAKSDVFNVLLSTMPINLSQIEVAPSKTAYQAFELFFRESQAGLMKRFTRVVMKTIKKIVFR